jgi:hypothetical protein
MENELSHYEELLLKSWDSALSAEERNTLAAQIQNDATLRWQEDQYLKIRTMIHRTTPDSFGPFFGERIINMIKNRAENLEYQIFFFFKKYQMLVAGIFVALLVTNLFLSESFTIREILGLEPQTTEEIYSINLYNDLTK